MVVKKDYPNVTSKTRSQDCPSCKSLLEQGDEGLVFELCRQCGKVWVDIGSQQPWRYDQTMAPSRRHRKAG